MFESERDCVGYVIDPSFLDKLQRIGEILNHPHKISFDERRDMAHIIWLILEQAEPVEKGDQI